MCFHGAEARSAPVLRAIEVASAKARSSCLAGCHSGLPKNWRACHLSFRYIFDMTAGWFASGLVLLRCSAEADCLHSR